MSEPITYGHPNLGCERLDPGKIGITDSPTDIWPDHGAPEREVSGHTNEGWGSTDTTDQSEADDRSLVPVLSPDPVTHRITSDTACPTRMCY